MTAPRLHPLDYLLAGYHALLALLWAGLVPVSTTAPAFLAAHAAGVALPFLLARRPERPAWGMHTLVALYPFICLAFFWGELGVLRFLRHEVPFDALVMQWETALFGVHLSAAWMPSFPRVWFSELMHLSYWAYYLLIVVPPLALLVLRRHESYRTLALRVMATYLACYVIYLVLPVDGPGHALPRYEGELTGGFFYQLTHATIAQGDSQGTAFPSSHTAGAVSIAIASWHLFPRWVGVLLWVEAIGVICSTIYTQNHFGVDVLAGLALAVGVQLVVVPFLLPGQTVAPRPILPVAPRLTPLRGGAQ